MRGHLCTNCTADDRAQQMLDLLVLEVARTRDRYRTRFPVGYACPASGERSWVAIGRGPTALAVRVRPEEGHHPHGEGQGVVFKGPIAVNRIAKEAERIAMSVGLFDADLCPHYLFGFGHLLGILLARIGLEP
jgi:hypothetical protein